MNNWVIRFYTNSRGDELVQDFIRQQDKPTYAKTIRLLGLIAKNGPNLGMPYSRYMQDGLYELRIRGKNEVRIFYVFQTEMTVFLLHAFKKRSKKTPYKELEIAINRKKELTII